MALRPDQLSERTVPDAQRLALQAGFPQLSPLSLRLLASRGLSGPATELSLDDLLPPDSLRGIQAAAELLLGALQRGDSIRIVGDYDVDGATATALMVDALQSGFQADVDYIIPNRFRHGYGLSPQLVADSLSGAAAPALLITVDNGIASHAGIRDAQQAGSRVLVTDHHLPGAEPCPADVVVNPNQPGCAFPSKVACGCTVAFYLLVALRQMARQQALPAPARNLRLADYLDLLALATVADVVPLDHNNRILVEQGLRRIRQGHARPGIQAILQQAGKDPARLTSSDLGFTLGPRLNAAGRMQDMALGVRCLLAKNSDEAQALARQLEEFNRDRRQRQSDMVSEAEQLSRNPDHAHFVAQDPIGVVWQKDWHEGLVGLVAGQLRESLERPVLALCPAQPESAGLYKGSARSIPGVHIRDLLAWVDAGHPGLITRFGGHAMAAGLTLPAARLAELAPALATAARALVPAEAWQTRRDLDGVLGPDELTLAQALELETLGPWGQGCPVPEFIGHFRVQEQRWLQGGEHLRLSLLPLNTGTGALAVPVPAIWFRCPLAGEELPDVLELVYELQVNRFRGRQSLQLLIRNHVTP